MRSFLILKIEKTFSDVKLINFTLEYTFSKTVSLKTSLTIRTASGEVSWRVDGLGLQDQDSKLETYGSTCSLAISARVSNG